MRRETHVYMLMDHKQPNTPRQLLLFEDDYLLRNQGVTELCRLNVEKAQELFERYQAVYPRGESVEDHLKLARLLLQGFADAPKAAAELPAYLHGFRETILDVAASHGYSYPAVLEAINKAFFQRIVETIDQHGLAAEPFVSDGTPTGYFYMQAGRFDAAVTLLQNSLLAAPGSARVYGYLGDAYVLRGEKKTARQCYREACLIDPAAIDWRHLQDEDLLALRDRMIDEYGLGATVGCEWLSSHAVIEGLFEQKALAVDKGLKELVDEYLTQEKSLLKEPSDRAKARLFVRGIILCGNEPLLRFVKRVSFIGIRQRMKEVNPELFSQYLDFVARTK